MRRLDGAKERRKEGTEDEPASRSPCNCQDACKGSVSKGWNIPPRRWKVLKAGGRDALSNLRSLPSAQHNTAEARVDGEVVVEGAGVSAGEQT